MPTPYLLKQLNESIWDIGISQILNKIHDDHIFLKKKKLERGTKDLTQSYDKKPYTNKTQLTMKATAQQSNINVRLHNDCKTT